MFLVKAVRNRGRGSTWVFQYLFSVENLTLENCHLSISLDAAESRPISVQSLSVPLLN
jgi:hypothetical protein